MGDYDNKKTFAATDHSVVVIIGSGAGGGALANEHNQSLLMAGSDDGDVRLWKNVHVKDTQPEIVSAWLADAPRQRRRPRARLAAGDGPPAGGGQ